MNADTLQPFDVLETPGHTQPYLYRIEGIHLGGLESVDLVELSPIDQRGGGAHGKAQAPFVPLFMIQAMIGAGLITVTRPE